MNNEHWMNKHWRPAMGWLYMAVCIFDFIVAPMIWSVLQMKYSGDVKLQWQPLTLQGAGLFHLAMGAVLGIYAYGRTKEKLELPNFGVGTTYVPPGGNKSQRDDYYQPRNPYYPEYNQPRRKSPPIEPEPLL